MAQNQNTQRIDMAEEDLKSTIRRLDKYAEAVSMDSEKASKVELAIKEQIDMI